MNLPFESKAKYRYLPNKNIPFLPPACARCFSNLYETYGCGEWKKGNEMVSHHNDAAWKSEVKWSEWTKRISFSGNTFTHSMNHCRGIHSRNPHDMQIRLMAKFSHVDLDVRETLITRQILPLSRRLHIDYTPSRGFWACVTSADLRLFNNKARCQTIDFRFSYFYLWVCYHH